MTESTAQKPAFTTGDFNDRPDGIGILADKLRCIFERNGEPGATTAYAATSRGALDRGVAVLPFRRAAARVPASSPPLKTRKSDNTDSLLGTLFMQALVGVPVAAAASQALPFDIPAPLAKIDWFNAIELYDEFRQDRAQNPPTRRTYDIPPPFITAAGAWAAPMPRI